MNALAVQNPRQCDLGKKSVSVTDKKITADDCNNNYYNYYIILYYICVCVCYNLHSTVE